MIDITYRDCTADEWLAVLTRRGEMLSVYRPGRERQVRFINDYGQAEERVYGNQFYQMKLVASQYDDVALQKMIGDSVKNGSDSNA